MEQWKDAPGYEGVYQVSDIGRIKSLYTNKIRKPKYDKNGYAVINLSKNGVIKTRKIHRLVAKAFIPNPNNYEIIDHINGKQYDNRVENLRWCTTKENVKFYYDRFALGELSKYKVLCKETNELFNSSYDASFWVIKNGLTNSTNFKSVSKAIRNNCKGTVKSSYGFHWAYIEGSTTSS